jgi:hypothetical protein
MSASRTSPNHLSALILLVIGGCAVHSDDAPELANETLAIELGQPEYGLPAVGKFMRGNDESDVCTGTLIAPDVVLTAEHCVHGDGWLYYPDGYTSGQGIGFRGADVYPGFVRDHRLVYLERSLPIAPLPIHPDPQSLLGAECLAVGFGVHHDSAGNVTIGNKRSGTVKITSIEPVMMHVELVTGIGNSGDSGGPLLCDGMIAGTVRGHRGDWPYTSAYYHSVNPAWIADPSIDPGVEGYDCSAHVESCAVDETGQSGMLTCDRVRGVYVSPCATGAGCFPFEDGLGLQCVPFRCEPMEGYRVLTCDPGLRCVTDDVGYPSCQPDADLAF